MNGHRNIFTTPYLPLTLSSTQTEPDRNQFPLMNMKQRRLLLFVIRCRRCKRLKRQKHRFCTREICTRRADLGEWNLFKEMYNHDHESFFRYFRMTPVKFDYILTLINRYISAATTDQAFSEIFTFLNSFNLVLYSTCLPHTSSINFLSNSRQFTATFVCYAT